MSKRIYDEYYRYEFELESDMDDYLNLGNIGINSYKLLNENKIILRFHSALNHPGVELGLLTAVITYALKRFNVLVITCHSNTSLPEWIKNTCEIIPVNNGNWSRIIFENGKYKYIAAHKGSATKRMGL